MYERFIDASMDGVMKYVMAPVAILLAVGLVIGVVTLPIHWFLTRNDVQTVELRTDEWRCVAEHNRLVEVCGKSGCRWEETTTCDAYERLNANPH